MSSVITRFVCNEYCIHVCMHVYMSMCVCANLSLYQGLHVIHHHCLLDIQVQDYCCLGYYLYQRGYGCVCVSKL